MVVPLARNIHHGVVDFDEKYEMHLINTGYSKLFSNGKVYFRSKLVYSDLSKQRSVIQNEYIPDFEVIVKDEDSINSSFLKILRNKFESK